MCYVFCIMFFSVHMFRGSGLFVYTGLCVRLLCAGLCVCVQLACGGLSWLVCQHVRHVRHVQHVRLLPIYVPLTCLPV